MKALIPALSLLILNLTDGAALTKEKYVYSGKNVYASINWPDEDCKRWTDGDYASTASFSAAEEVSKVRDDGKPETSKHSYVDAWYDTYYDCDDTGYKRKWVTFWNEETPTVAIKDNLKSASVSSTGQGWVTYEHCTYACDVECSYTCDYTIPESVAVTLTATVVATGTPEKTKAIVSKDQYPHFSYFRKSSGTSVDATVSTITFTVDGEQPIPPGLPIDSTYAYIAKTKNGTFTKYVKGI